MRHRSFLRVVCAIAGALFLACCESPADTAPPAAPPQVATITVQTMERVPHIESFGTLSYLHKTELSSSVSGTVLKVHVEEGEAVRQGELLVRLENLQIGIRLRKAKSALEQARSALDLSNARLREARLAVDTRILALEKCELQIARQEAEVEELVQELADQRELRTLDGVSQSALDAAELAVARARTELASLRKEREMRAVGLRDCDLREHGYSVPPHHRQRRELLRTTNTLSERAECAVAASQFQAARCEVESARLLHAALSLRAPSSGIVAVRHLQPGERTEPGTKLITIFNSNELLAVFPVREGEAALIEPGQTVEIDVPAAGKSYRGAVDRISPALDPRSGNLTIKARLHNRNRLLRPGMFVRVRVLRGERERCIRIPSACLVRRDGSRGSIYRLVNGRVFAQELELGEEEAGEVLVRGGLEEGERIVHSPSPLLQEGEKVDAIEHTQPTRTP